MYLVDFGRDLRTDSVLCRISRAPERPASEAILEDFSEFQVQ